MTSTFDVREDLLVDRVVELLRDRIIEGSYARGEPLASRRLAEELNVDATVVGEALRVLRREGLVSRGRAILAAVWAQDGGEAERAAQGHACRGAQGARGTLALVPAAAGDETRPAG